MASKVRERRLGVQAFEVRDASDNGVTLEGYASTYNEPYSMGYYTEIIAPTAFKRTLGQKPDVRLLINHNGLPLARTTSGTLTLDTDSRGLFVRAQLEPDDPDVAALLPKMRRGDLNQMSFGFGIVETDWSPDYTIATRTQLDLTDGDVSVVTFPANPGTSVAVRAAGQPSVDGLAVLFRDMAQRTAAPSEIAAVLQRALGYFASVDAIVDQAQADVADELGVPNPDVDDDEAAARAAVLTDLERRRRVLALL